MHIFKRRLEECEELIMHGDIQGAIRKMKFYETGVLREGSILGQLFARISTFDANIKGAISYLERNNPRRALQIINALKTRDLRKIHSAAQDVAKQEFQLEK